MCPTTRPQCSPFRTCKTLEWKSHISIFAIRHGLTVMQLFYHSNSLIKPFIHWHKIALINYWFFFKEKQVFIRDYYKGRIKSQVWIATEMMNGQVLDEKETETYGEGVSKIYWCIYKYLMYWLLVGNWEALAEWVH